MSEQKLTLEDIIQEFIEVNQRVYTKMETLCMTLEAIEITLVPIQQELFINIKEFKGSAMQFHRKNVPLSVGMVDFDEHLKRHAGISMRTVDMRNLNAATVERLLAQEQDIDIEQKGTDDGQDRQDREGTGRTHETIS